MANNFFSALAGVPMPDTYFHLGGGGFGGPVVQKPHVLLVRHRELRLEHHAQRRASRADRAREGGRLLAVASTAPAARS